MLLVLSKKGKGMQSSSEQPLVGEECFVTTLITAAKETTFCGAAYHHVEVARQHLGLKDNSSFAIAVFSP